MLTILKKITLLVEDRRGGAEYKGEKGAPNTKLPDTTAMQYQSK
jgi:hypothetical protein